MTQAYRLPELAQRVGGTLRGTDDGRTISGVNDLAEAQTHEAAWLSNPRYQPMLATSKAGVVLVRKDCESTPMPAIVCGHIDHSIAKLLEAFAPEPALPDIGVHPTAVIHSTASVGAAARIGPHVVIEAGVRIGANATLCAGVFIGRDTSLGDHCTLLPHVVVHERCIIGNRVRIKANAVIGGEGFGFYFDGKKHQRIPHIGAVRVEDDVEIGSCSCVDRSKFGFTVIGAGTKIDNHVQIAHNVRTKEHCLFAGHSGIGGSVHIGRFCIFGGRAGATDNISIGDGVRVGLGSFAINDVPTGQTISGFWAQEHRAELKSQTIYRRLPKIVDQLKELIARIEKLEASTHHQP